MSVVLALDVGSTFAKAQRFDDEGVAVGSTTRRATGIGREGLAALDDVVATVDQLVDDALESGPDPVAVAVSSAWHTLVGLDAEGRATTELSTWLDDRAGPEAAVLRGLVTDGRDLHDRTGAPIHPSLPSARLAWLAHHRPDAFQATRRWCSLPEALASRWFGEVVGPSSSVASGSGLYDQRERAWDRELLEALAVAPGTLAPVDDESRTGLVASYRSRWPALADVPWFPAFGDGACAAVSAGCSTPGRAALTVGTSAAVRVLSTGTARWARPLPTPLFGYLLDEDRPVVGAARSNAGGVISWASEVLRVDAPDLVAAATVGRRPGTHGLEADPSLVAERSPAWPLVPTASIGGLRRATTALDVVQGLVEAVALGLADAVEALERWAGHQMLVLGGGASASAGWRQLLADAIGRPLVWSQVSEASARGAALVAFERLGTPLPNVSPGEDLVHPDPDRAEAFALLRAAEPRPRFAASLGP